MYCGTNVTLDHCFELAGIKEGAAPPSRSVSPTHMEDVEGVFKVISEDHGGFNVKTDEETPAENEDVSSQPDEQRDSEQKSKDTNKGDDKDGEMQEENNNEIKSKTVTELASDSLVVES